MRARAVPVALDRLRVERRRDAEVLGDAVQQPARDPQLVGDVERAERADLELPLAGHHLGVDAGDPETGFEARVEVRLDDRRGRTPRRRRHRSSRSPAARGSRRPGKPCGRPSLKNVYSCSMPNSGSCFAYFSATGREQRARVRRVRRHVGEQHFAHHEHVVAAADRVGAREHRLQHAVGVCPAPGSCSNRRSPRSAGSQSPSVRIFVFERRRAVGSVPSIQMYSALIATSGSCARQLGRMLRRASVDRSFPARQFPGRCPNVNALLPRPCRPGEPYATVPYTVRMERQLEYVLRTVEERGVRFVRLWFTDVLGFLKSVEITPAELEVALEEGMTFDGSTIEGYSRIQESDMLAKPDPNTFELLPERRRRRGRRPHVLRHPDVLGRPVRRRPALRAEAQPRAGPGEGLHVLRRARDGVLLLPHRASRWSRSTTPATSTSPRTTSARSCASRRCCASRRWASPSSTRSTRTARASTRSTCATPTRSRWPTT